MADVPRSEGEESPGTSPPPGPLLPSLAPRLPALALRADTSSRADGSTASRGASRGGRALSPEAEELRQLLRQDMQDCLRGVVGEEVRELRRDLQEWLSRGRAPAAEQPRSPHGHATPREPVGASISLGTVEETRALERAVCVEDAPRSPCPRRDLDALVERASIASAEPEEGGSTPVPAEGEEEGRASLWEWERSNGMGWKAYPLAQSDRIEKHYQSGVSRMRLRSGKEGRTPMEIYFVDMMQLDPDSGNTRRIRRLGEVTPCARLGRLCRAVSRSLETWEPCWESLDQYRHRQSTMESGKHLRSKETRLNITISPFRNWLRRRVQGRSVASASMAVTLCWSVYVGFDVQRYPDDRVFYDKDPASVAAELCFGGFFVTELCIRIGASRSTLEFFREVWNTIDLLCVMGTFADFVIMPVSTALFRGAGRTETELTVLRTLRLVKLLRVLRLTRASRDVNMFLSGVSEGIKESAIVWAILIGMVFVFSVLLMSYAGSEVRAYSFSDLGSSMNRLVVSGIFLDSPGKLCQVMLESNDIFSYVLFILFVILSQYIILNMLIGVISSVAVDVRDKEQSAATEQQVRHSLKSIVDCYLTDDGMISQKEFRLIIKNADVYKVLQRFGVDIEQVALMEGSLYAKEDDIDFDSLFEAVAHLNGGKPATVRDIFHSQDVLRRTMHSLEVQLNSALFGDQYDGENGKRSRSKPCSPRRPR